MLTGLMIVFFESSYCTSQDKWLYYGVDLLLVAVAEMVSLLLTLSDFLLTSDQPLRIF